VGCILAAVPAGLGFGLLMPNFSLKLVIFAPESIRGKLLGGLTFAFFMGQFASPLGTVLLPDALELFGVTSYALTVLAGIVLLLRKWYSGKL
jgi:MFS family permease